MLIGTIAALFILLHIPAVQGYIGQKTAEAISEKLHTRVSVGKVNVGFLNRVVIDDFELYDQKDKKMLTASRLSAKVDIAPLLKGRISVSSAQIFGMKALLYKESADQPANFQFAIDALKSEEKEEKKPLDLNINSLIVRNGAVKYDRLDIPPSAGQLSPHHLDITNLSTHVMLYRLTDDKIDLKVKRVSMKEASGLDLRRLSLDLQANKQHALISDLSITLPQSRLQADTLEATYLFTDGDIDTKTLKYRVQLQEAALKSSDLAFVFPKMRESDKSFNLSAKISGTSDQVDVGNLQVTSGDDLRLTTNGLVSWTDKKPVWFFRIGNLSVRASAVQEIAQMTGTRLTLPPSVANLGRVEYVGEVGSDGNEYAMKGLLSTDAGKMDLMLGLKEQHLTAHINTDGVDVKAFVSDSPVGTVATTIDLDGTLPIGRQMSLLAKGNVRRLDFNNHTYNNINIDGFYDKESFKGIIGIDDALGQLNLDGQFNLSAASPSAKLKASARHFNPEALGLTSQLPGHVFDFDLSTDVAGSNLKDLKGIVDIQQFSLQAPGKSYHLSELHIDADNQSAEKHVILQSDFGEVRLDGQYDIEHIPDGILSIISSKLPTLPILSRNLHKGHNNYSFTADIDRSDWLHQLTDLNININSPLHISGHVDDDKETIDLTCFAPSVEYNDGDYRDIDIQVTTLRDTIHTNASLVKMQDDGKRFDLSLTSTASGNELTTNLKFNNHGRKQSLKGDLSATTDFYLDALSRKTAHVRMNHSQIFVNNMPWDVEPSDLQLAKGHIIIDDFTIKNGDQHIIIAGSLTDNPNDTIHVDLNQLDASFLSSILHVRGVDFGGRITGNAFLASFHDSPSAKADLYIDNFQFVDGRLGDMRLNASWEKQANKIEFNGIALDGDQGKTDIDGFVALSPGELNIDIQAQGTPLLFLKRFCGSFMDDIAARVDGNVRIFGPLSNINMEGKVVGNGDISLSSLNTVYTMRNDTVTLIPDHIIFDADSIYDREGHRAIVNGSVDHRHLGNFTFDLDIQADNLLAYDFKEFGDDTFCGTVYATGDCHIKGVSGEVSIDVDATPQKNTVFYYNAASPEILSRQDFIQWNDITPEAIDYSYLPSASKSAPLVADDTDETEEDDYDIPSNLRMNFNINATPDAALRLLMDTESGDFIELHGSGALRASYFNKGAFNLFGNYLVDHGIYKLTIQNIIKKDFQFQRGGTIVFGGNPYDAALDLKAQYAVNGVSLSDLNIGQSFTNNIRVNCIMNITGTPNQPAVDFDLEMPTVNADAQQMVRSIINSEEELNQQVIYLLAIGKFYNQNANAISEDGQSQTSLAMQSLLSGTISQQINNVLSGLIKNNNWNFGANISTGNEGFNNAEYEGLLSGRLLDNRLLINGEFGYRDNPNATTSFIGDFDIQYLLYPNGNLAVKVYNQTNDRYFIKNSLNTQGVGLIMKKDFNGWRELVGRRKKEKTIIQK